MYLCVSWNRRQRKWGFQFDCMLLSCLLGTRVTSFVKPMFMIIVYVGKGYFSSGPTSSGFTSKYLLLPLFATAYEPRVYESG